MSETTCVSQSEVGHTLRLCHLCAAAASSKSSSLGFLDLKIIRALRAQIRLKQRRGEAHSAFTFGIHGDDSDVPQNSEMTIISC